MLLLCPLQYHSSHLWVAPAGCHSHPTLLCSCYSYRWLCNSLHKELLTPFVPVLTLHSGDISSGVKFWRAETRASTALSLILKASLNKAEISVLPLCFCFILIISTMMLLPGRGQLRLSWLTSTGTWMVTHPWFSLLAWSSTSPHPPKGTSVPLTAQWTKAGQKG